MSDTPSYDPPKPPAPSGGLPPALANLSDRTLLWIQVGGGAVAFIGSLLSWVTLSTPGGIGVGFSQSYNAFHFGFWGILAFILAILVTALAAIKVFNVTIQGFDKLPSWLPLVLTGVLALIAVIEWLGILTGFASVTENGVSASISTIRDFGTSASTGAGIWLVLLASLAAFGATLLPVLKARGTS